MSLYFIDRPGPFSNRNWFGDFFMDQPKDETDILFSRPCGYPSSNGDQWWSEQQLFPAYFQPSIYEPSYRSRSNKNRAMNTEDIPQRRFKKRNMNRSIPIQIFHEKDASDTEEEETNPPRNKVSIKTPKGESNEALESSSDVEQSDAVTSDNGDASGRKTSSDETELLRNEERVNTPTDEPAIASDIENEDNIEAENASDHENAASDAAVKVQPDEADPSSSDQMDTSETEPEAASAESEDESAVNAEKLAADALKAIATVMETFEKLEEEIEQFVATRKEKTYLRLEHELTNKLLCLDKVSAAGTQKENEIRSERKAAINRVQRALDILENKT